MRFSILNVPGQPRPSRSVAGDLGPLSFDGDPSPVILPPVTSNLSTSRFHSPAILKISTGWSGRLPARASTISLLRKASYPPRGPRRCRSSCLMSWGSFAEFERALIREGIAVAKTKDVYKGRKLSTSPASRSPTPRQPTGRSTRDRTRKLRTTTRSRGGLPVLLFLILAAPPVLG